jgi:hypothetical protein
MRSHSTLVLLPRGHCRAPRQRTGRLVRYVGCVAAALLVGACADEATAPKHLQPGSPALATATAYPTVTIVGAPTSLAVGASDTLRATIKDSSGRTWTCTSCVWRSSDTTVLAIKSWRSSAGYSLASVTAKKGGSATVTATTSSNTSGSVTISTVAAAPSAPLAYPLVTILNRNKYVAVGAADTLPLSLGLADTLRTELQSATGSVYSGKSITWTSSDTTVLALRTWKNSVGVSFARVMPKRLGAATIIARTGAGTVRTLSFAVDASGQTAAQWWAGLTPLERGKRINAEARRWIGADSLTLNNRYRCICKPFIRFAVNRASRGVVYLTPTVDTFGQSDWTGWQLRVDAHTRYVTDYRVGTIQQTMVGDVVQSNTDNGNTHTFIVTRVTPDTVYTVDAHWHGCDRFDIWGDNGGVLAHRWSTDYFKRKFIRWAAYRMN